MRWSLRQCLGCLGPKTDDDVGTPGPVAASADAGTDTASQATPDISPLQDVTGTAVASSSASTTPQLDAVADRLVSILQQPPEQQYAALQEQNILQQLDQVLDSLEAASKASAVSKAAGKTADALTTWGAAATTAAKTVEDTIKKVKAGAFGGNWEQLGKVDAQLADVGASAGYVGPLFSLVAFALKQWSAYAQVPSDAFAVMRSCHDLLSDIMSAYPHLSRPDAKKRMEVAASQAAKQVSEAIIIHKGSFMARVFTAQVQTADLSKATDRLTRLRISLMTLLLLELRAPVTERKQLTIDADKLYGMDQQEAELAAMLLVPGLQQQGLWLHGMGGSGKSTLAKRLYNRLVDGHTHLPGYKHRAFISLDEADKGECLRQHLIRVLEQLRDSGGASQHAGPSFSPHADTAELQTVLRHFVRDHAVLLVVDNVWTVDQLQTLLPGDFGDNSRFIITSRLEHMYYNSHVYQDLKYRDIILNHRVQQLDAKSATELFCHWNNTSDTLAEDLSTLRAEIIKACGGLPLAIKLAGGLLATTNTQPPQPQPLSRWKAVLRALKEGNPLVDHDSNNRLQHVVRASFEHLTPIQQNMFLDTVSIFRNYPYNVAMDFWTTMWPDDDADGNFRQLLLHALVTVVVDRRVGNSPHLAVHDVIRSLGQGIMRMPGPFCGSRVWTQDDGRLPIFSQGEWQPPTCIALSSGRIAEQCWATLMSRDMRQLRFVQSPWQLGLQLLHSQQLELRTMPSLQILDLSVGGRGGLITWRNFPKPYDTVPQAELPAGIGTLSALQRLDLSGCDQVTSLPESLGGLGALTMLNISRCGIRCLPASLVQLKSLRVLDASFSNLRYLVPELAEPQPWQLTKLEKVDLGGCSKLFSLPAGFGASAALRILDLRFCMQLTLMPESLNSLQALEKLNLSGYRALSGLPSLKQLLALSSFTFSRCRQLTCLPELLQQLPASQQLQELDLSEMPQLTSLPEFRNIPALRGLTQLNLSGCTGLGELPGTISELAALKHLDLSLCVQLSFLPQSLGQLKTLQLLTIYDCKKLHSLPPTFWHLTALTRLELNGCEQLSLQSDDPLGQLTALERLHLEKCVHLTCLPTSVGGLAALQRLYLGGCVQLSCLPDSFGNLAALQDLRLNGCVQLSCLPDSFGNLAALKELNLRGCVQLKSLGASFTHLGSLTQLNLSGCVQLYPEAAKWHWSHEDAMLAALCSQLSISD